MLQHLKLEIDHGTPARESTETVTLEIDGMQVTVPRGHLADARGSRGRHQGAQAVRHRQPGALRLLPAVPGGDRGPQGLSRPRAPRRPKPGMKVRTQTPQAAGAAQGRDGALHLRPPAGLPDLRAPTATASCRTWPASPACARCATAWRRRRTISRQSKKDESNPYFSLRPQQVHRLQPLRARLRGDAGHLRADHLRARLRVAASRRGRTSRSWTRECVSLRRLRRRPARPPRCRKRRVIELGQPEHSVITTCAYCGVGCGFKAEMKGNEVVRMVPWKDGKANEGHSCVKGRFAWGYATHKDRITKPMIRAKITDPWREVSWDEAIDYAASRVQAHPGKVRHAIRSAASPPAAAPTKRSIWCRSWCAPPSATTTSTPAPASAIRPPATAWADLRHLGRHADLQVGRARRRDHGHRRQPDRRAPGVRLAHEARLREGAKLIVIDPRRIDLVSAPHVEADYHLAAQPGTNVAVITALAHVIVTEGLVDEDFVAERCDDKSFSDWRDFVAQPENSPEAMRSRHRRAGGRGARRRAAVCHRRQLRPSTTAWASPSTRRARPW